MMKLGIVITNCNILEDLHEWVGSILRADDGPSEYSVVVEHLGLDGKVSFKGYASDETRQSTFADSDVFMTPNFSRFPETFLEACVWGTPLVTTTNGDQPDWTHNQVGGVTQYNAAGLSKAT